MTKNTVRVTLCLVALLAIVMATTLLHCHAAGRNIGTAAAGDEDPWAKKCVLAKGCAPEPNPPSYHDDACKAMCFQEGYSTDKSYCSPDGGGTCCCVKN